MKKKTKLMKARDVKSKYSACRIMEYPVIIHHSKYGYDVSCPLLPGCATQGDTHEEALENIKSAIQEYLEAVSKIKKNERLVMVKVPV